MRVWPKSNKVLNTVPLKDQVAFITGASRGIGQACAIAMARAGAHCVLSARNQAGLLNTDNEIRKNGNQATLLPLDLSCSNRIDVLGPSIAERFQRLDILVHAAFHFAPLSPIQHIHDTIWDQCLTANLTSCRRLIRTFYPLLNKSHKGRAIFVQGSTIPNAYWSHIVPINAAIKALIECWQLEIASISNVKVSYITPLPTHTSLRTGFYPAEDKQNLLSPKQSAALILSSILSEQAL
ncbi:putative oxidoreductase YciK [Commensalibacter sp. Nvir]|nr:putative oxidoreductase YciK [Commensalibacter sp. Nvir]